MIYRYMVSTIEAGPLGCCIGYVSNDLDPYLKIRDEYLKLILDYVVACFVVMRSRQLYNCKMIIQCKKFTPPKEPG